MVFKNHCVLVLWTKVALAWGGGGGGGLVNLGDYDPVVRDMINLYQLLAVVHQEQG